MSDVVLGREEYAFFCFFPHVWVGIRIEGDSLVCDLNLCIERPDVIMYEKLLS